MQGMGDRDALDEDNETETHFASQRQNQPSEALAFAMNPGLLVEPLALSQMPIEGCIGHSLAANLPQHLFSTSGSRLPAPQAHFHRRESGASTASSLSKSKRESLKSEETSLGYDFKPGPWHVLCGRSKHNFDHIANRRLRLLVANNLKAYVEAPTRRDKSGVISKVADMILHGCHDGGFVRREKDGRWVKVGPSVGREKVSHAFRDCLLKQTRKSKSPIREEKEEEGRQRTWKEAQDDIFRSLQLHSKKEKASDQKQTQSVSNQGAGLGGNTANSLQMQTRPHLLQALNQSNSHHSSIPAMPLHPPPTQQRQHQQQRHGNTQTRDNNSNQINENLLHGNIFRWYG